MKTSEERKAEFDALLDRCIQLGSLLPKTLTPENSDTVELITREMVLVGRQIQMMVLGQEGLQ
jgi:hypothetical protein